MELSAEATLRFWALLSRIAMIDPFDPSQCAGSQNGCRWCQLIGALAFDEERPGLPGASTALAPAGQAGAEPAGPASAGPPAAQPAGSAAAEQVAGPSVHPKAPPGWVGVEVPAFPTARRRMDSDFMQAHRKLVRPLPQDRLAAIERGSRAECSLYIERRDISFAFWCLFSFDALWASVVTIAMQPFVLRSYIGISEEPTWRWARCEHHSNMRPHYLDYDRMFVLTACYGSNCCGMERLLQQKLLNHAPSKCAFSDRYRRGPIHDGRVYFLYCCVNLRKRRLE